MKRFEKIAVRGLAGMVALAFSANADQRVSTASADLFAFLSDTHGHCERFQGQVEIHDWMPLPSVELEKSSEKARLTLAIPVRDRRFTYYDIPMYWVTFVFCDGQDAKACQEHSDISIEFMNDGDRYIHTDFFEKTHPKTIISDGTKADREVETQELLENLHRGIQTLLKKNGDYAKKSDGAQQWNALMCAREVIDRILKL